jgi:neutral ceramidase
MNHLRAGAARTNLTPERLPGLNPFGDDFISVRDPIYARGLVLDDGETRCAIVALDLVEVGDTKDLRERIENELGIPADRIILAPSHSHNAPRIGLVPPGGKARIPTPESLVFTRKVYDDIVDTLAAAQAALQRVAVGSGRGVVDVNISRDAYVDGRWALGHNPDGASDKTLSVVVLRAETGEIVAILMNYAVHSTVGLGVPELSADLAGSAAALVEAELGGETVALWLSGALGDQAPRIELGEPTGDAERDRRFAHAAVDAQGLLIADAAIGVARDIRRFRSDVKIAGGERIVACPARSLDVPPGMEQAAVDTVDLTLTCIMIGGIALAGVSGEVTVPVYRSLLAASPLTTTLVVSNANARIGYLPGDEAYDRHTQAAEGCPIVKGYAERSIVDGLVGIIDSQLDRA